MGEGYVAKKSGAESERAWFSDNMSERARMSAEQREPRWGERLRLFVRLSRAIYFFWLKLPLIGSSNLIKSLMEILRDTL